MKIDLTHVQPFLDKNLKSNLESRVSEVYETIFNKTGAGNDFLGWVNLPSEIDESLLADIEKTAADLRKKSDLFVVIGISSSSSASAAPISAPVPSSRPCRTTLHRSPARSHSSSTLATT